MSKWSLNNGLYRATDKSFKKKKRTQDIRKIERLDDYFACISFLRKLEYKSSQKSTIKAKIFSK